MTQAHMLYLGMAICAFIYFGAMLFTVHIWSNLPPKRKSKTAQATRAERAAVPHDGGRLAA